MIDVGAPKARIARQLGIDRSSPHRALALDITGGGIAGTPGQ
ncbi:hypothetical protein [Paeniglutamicibacter cryotolerans]|nr:hypothetical protein [Paeniglutamicibacter cryotolerans]